MDIEERETFIEKSYEEALSTIGLGKFHYFLLITCGLCLMTVIIESFNIGFVIPLIDLECHLKLELADKGILNAATFAGIVLSSYLWGFMADIKGRHQTMFLCSSLTFIFSFTSSFSTHIYVLIVARFLVGFFVSGLSANTYAYFGEFLSEKNRQKYLNLCGAFFTFAFMFCPGVAWVFMNFEDFFIQIPLIDMKYSIWRIFLLLCSLPSFIVTACLFFLPESPKFLLSQQKHDEALKIIEKVYKWNGRSNEFPINKIHINETISRDKSKSFCTQFLSQSMPLFKKPLIGSTWKIAFLMFSLFAASSGFFMWVPEILNSIEDNRGSRVCEVIDKVIAARNNNTSSICEGYHVNIEIYKITFFMGCFFSTISFLNAFLINKIGKRNLLAIWFLLSASSAFFVVFTSNYFMINFLLLIFLTCGCNGSITSSLIVDSYPTNVRAISLCIHSMIGRFGAVIGSIFVSQILIYSCDSLFYTFGVLLIISIFISLALK